MKTKNSPRVLHIIGCIDPRTGGPAASVSGLVKGLISLGAHAEVYSFGFPYRESKDLMRGFKLHQAPSCGKICFGGINFKAYGELADISKNFNLIHNHGMWLFPNYMARVIAQKKNIPLVSSLRGHLGDWEMSRSRLKKKIAWGLYERKNLESVNLFHATSEFELQSIRKNGFSQPAAVIPNGVGVPTVAGSASAQEFKERFPGISSDKKTLLFLSRIDPKKGLERLLDVWAEVSPKFEKWQLIIAGEGPPDYVQKLKKKASDLGLLKNCFWIGHVEGRDKEIVLSAANLFVLPSFSENFGNAVAEALAQSVPVFVTKGVPWCRVKEKKCGWWCDNSIEGIQRELVQALSLTSEQLARLGENGRDWMSAEYSWENVSGKMLDAYAGLLCDAGKT